MKLEITASALRSALTLIDKVIERRNTIPVLGTVKFDGRKLSATNLDMEILVSVPATRASGSACIEHRPMFGLVKHIADDEMVTISAGRGEATISFDGGRYDLPTIDPNDFPNFDLGEVKPVPFDGEKFRRALAFSGNFMSSEETRYYLNGVCVDAEGAVATDGHRLGFHPLGFEGSGFQRAIFPRKVVDFIASAHPAQSLSVNERKVLVQFDGMTLAARLIEGTFPDWRRVVPQDGSWHAQIDTSRSTLITALSRLMSVRAKPQYASVAWSDGAVALGTKCLGEISVREFPSDITAKGNPGSISLRADYIRSLLQAFKTDERVKIDVVDKTTPAIFRGSEDGPFAILMPARAYDDKFDASLQDECAARSDQRAAA